MSLLLFFAGSTSGGVPAVVVREDRVKLGQKETIGVTVTPTVGGGAIHG